MVVEGASAALAPAVDVGGLSCALLDLDLGDGDGTELARALRRAAPGLPIAFFSAGAAADLVARAVTVGPVCTKPDELDRAVAWIQANAT